MELAQTPPWFSPFKRAVQCVWGPRTPLRPQFQTTECGVSALQIMLAYFGADVPVAEVRRVSGVSRDCVTASDLRRAALAFGLECRVLSLEIDRLAALSLPVIVHLRFIHFVVLEQITADKVRINCPASGRLDMPMEQFDEAFTGIVLSLAPGEDFQKTVAPYLHKRRRWFPRRAVTANAVGSLALETVRATALVVFIDALFSASHGGRRLMVGLVALLLSSGLCVALRRRFAERLHRTLRDHVARQMEAAPFSFFVYRLPEVLADVLGSSRRLADSLEGSVAPAVLGLVGAGIMGVGARLTDGPAGVELIAALALWGAAVALLSSWKRRSELGWGGEAGRSVNDAFVSLYTPEHHRLGDGPDRFRTSLAGSAASEQERRLRVDAPAWLLFVAPYALVVVNTLLVYQNAARLSPQALMRLLTFGAAMGLLAAPLTHLRGLIGWYRQRFSAIDDVMQEEFLLPCEAGEGDHPKGGGGGQSGARPLRHAAWRRATSPARCSGEEEEAQPSVRIENVTFRFNPARPPLLDQVSFVLRPGEQVGLTGPSGEGKSTLTELMCGLHTPESGAVWVDGRPVQHIPIDERAGCIVRVDRHPVVFETSLRENLQLGNPAISEADLATAIEDAGLDELVRALPQGLETQMAFDGRNFSGGQLQRLEIARALARNPRIVILDDAIDALDLPTELKIRAALRRRGCTVLLVGHRAASLAACDRLLVFSGGQVGEAPIVGASSPAPGPAPAAADLSIFGKVAAAPERAWSDREDEQVLKVWRWLWPEVADSVDAAPRPTSRWERLARLAAQNGMALRVVRFTMTAWWARDVGTLVVFRKDGVPLGVRSRPWGATLFDPGAGASASLTLRASGDFETQAYAFTPLKAETVETVEQWSGRLLRSSLPDLLFAALSLLGVAWLLCRLVTPAAGHGGVLPVGSAVLAGGCLLYAAKGFLHRCDAAMAAQSNRLLHTLSVNLEADFSRRWEPAALYRGLGGLRDRLEQLRQAYRRGLLAAGIVVCGTVAAAFAAGASAAILVLASALGLGGLQALGGYVARGQDGALDDAGLAAHRQRLTALRGVARLRLLDASAWSFAQGVRGDDLETHLGRPGRLAGALADSLSPALAATVLWAAGFQLYRFAALVPLIWLCGMAGTEIGRQVSQALAAPSRRQTAGKLLAGPRARGRHKVREDWSLLSARDLSCSYAGRAAPIFDGVSLDVRVGDITVLTGPSGGGKSTLLRILLGMQRASGGQVLVDGQDLDSIELSAWRRSLAGVFQGEMLEQTVTIRGQLSTGTMHPISRIWEVLEIVEMVDEVQSMPMGLQTIVEPGRISNGQQQRLLIAKALLITPRLLVLDEATNAISEEMQHRIFERLRAQKVGCLIVTHRQSVIDAADTVYLVNGTVRFLGDGAHWKARGQEATFAPQEAELP